MLKKIKSEKLFKSTFYVFIYKLTGVCFNFLIAYLIAKFYGAYEIGIYFVIFGITIVLSHIGALGLPDAILAHISHEYRESNIENVNYLLRKSLIKTFLGSSILAVICFVFSSLLNDLFFSSTETLIYLRLFIISIIPLSINRVMVEFFKAIDKIKYSLIISQFGLPLFFVIFIFIFRNSQPLYSIYLARLLAIFLVTILTIYYLYKSKIVIQLKGYENKLLLNKFIESRKPLFIMVIFSMIIAHSDTIILGIYNIPNNEIGIYNTAKKIAGLLIFFLFAVNTILTPKFSNLYNNNKIIELKKIYYQSLFLLFITSTPILCIVLIFPEFILGLFGEEFKNGKIILTIAIIGQYINVVLGSVGQILMMCGAEKVIRNNFIVVAILLFIALFIFIPIYGTFGAAIITSTGIIVLNTANFLYVRKRVFSVKIN